MPKNRLFSSISTLKVKGKLIDLSTPAVMGILNVTPDSFYEGSRANSVNQVITRAIKMIEEGVDIIDIGGFSSRPGARTIDEEEEINRIVKPIAALRNQFPDIIISLDTFRASVARAGLNAGAEMINDITAGAGDPRMIDLIAKEKVPYLIMHMRGSATEMMAHTNYKNLIKEILDFFHVKLSLLKSKGIFDVIIDPGFGFSKTLDQNYELLNNLQYFNRIGAPMLVGLSRKSMIYKFLNTQPEDALTGTNILNFAALQKGARILRVHDVKEDNETIKLYKKLTN